MKRMKYIPALLLALLVPSGTHAQYEVPHGHICAGSGSSGGSHTLYCTAGQAGSGMSTGEMYEQKGGFWYIAWEISTVDVAVTSVLAEYTGEAVVIYWTVKADSQFEGFNVYRAEGAVGNFFKLNEELLPAGDEPSYRDETILPGETYLYRIGAVEGESELLSIDLEVSLPPAKLSLYQNYPNPFNPSTSIKCYLPRKVVVTLEIFDVAGRRVAILADREILKGFQVFKWDGSDANGDMSASGVYFYRLVAGKKRISRKMVLLR